MALEKPLGSDLESSRAINDAVIEGLSGLIGRLPDVVITHQTGEADVERVREAYRCAGVQAEVVPFLYDMPKALRSADLGCAEAGHVHAQLLPGHASVLERSLDLPHRPIMEPRLGADRTLKTGIAPD